LHLGYFYPQFRTGFRIFLSAVQDWVLDIFIRSWALDFRIFLSAVVEESPLDIFIRSGRMASGYFYPQETFDLRIIFSVVLLLLCARQGHNEILKSLSGASHN